jgi:hypothetical protein
MSAGGQGMTGKRWNSGRDMDGHSARSGPARPARPARQFRASASVRLATGNGDQVARSQDMARRVHELPALPPRRPACDVFRDRAKIFALSS